MAEPTPDAEALALAAELAGIAIHAECVPGVLANLALLGGHRRNVEEFAIPEEPA
ncbi:MAG: hypothetical protein WDN24_08925 [Sphingomonas sp.]